MYTKSARNHQTARSQFNREHCALILAIWTECDSLYSVLTAACSRPKDPWTEVTNMLRTATQYAPVRSKNLESR
jgi:hypothetical protein